MKLNKREQREIDERMQRFRDTSQCRCGACSHNKMQELLRSVIARREFPKIAKLAQKELRRFLKDLDKFEKRSRKSKIVVKRK